MQAQPRRLPVDLVVRRSFAFAWESRAVLAGPYVAYVILTVGIDLLGVLTIPHGSNLPVLMINGAEEVFAMAFAVGIHRFVLLAEAPVGFRFFRFDRSFVRYAVASLLLVVATLTAGLPALFAVSGGESSASGGAAVLGLVIFIAAATALCRLAMALPSAAIGEPVQPQRTWEATKGNGVRLLAVIIVTFLPFLAIEAILLRLLPSQEQVAAGGGLVRELLLTVAAGLVSPVQLIVVTIMLALCYDALVRGNGPPGR